MFMLRRIASAYLWFAPLLLMTPLWFVYHKIGLPAGIAGAAAGLILMAFAMWARGIFEWEDLPTAYGLARLFLVGGGAIVWVMGAAGPPRRHDVTLAFYNNWGLLVGLFVILLGFAALKTELQTAKRGALAAVGHAAFSVSYFVWVLQCCMIWAFLRAPAMGLPKPQQPDWLLFVYPVWEQIDSLRLVSVYLAGAAFASAGILTGRINRWPGRLMLGFSLIGAIFGIPQAIPFFIPAVTCIVPYYLGLTLHRSAKTEPV
jgi:hypothetical protein